MRTTSLTSLETTPLHTGSETTQQLDITTLTVASSSEISVLEEGVEEACLEKHNSVRTMLCETSSQLSCSTETDVLSKPWPGEFEETTVSNNSLNCNNTKNKSRYKSKKSKPWDKLLKVKSNCSKSNVTLRQKILRKQQSKVNTPERSSVYSPCTELRKGETCGFVDYLVFVYSVVKTTYKTLYGSKRDEI